MGSAPAGGAGGPSGPTLGCIRRVFPGHHCGGPSRGWDGSELNPGSRIVAWKNRPLFPSR